MNLMPGFNLTFEILIFLFTVALTFAVSELIAQVLVLRRRLGGGVSTGTSPGGSFLKQGKVRSPFLRWVQSSTSIAEPKERQKLARDLSLAGFEQPAAPAWYVITRFSLAIALPFTFLLVQRLLGFQPGRGGQIFWSLLLCAVGLLAPRSFVDRRARSRREQLEREFPDALDLMVVCVEAGLGLGAAFVRVAHEMRESHSRIAAEFERVSEQFRAGQSQSEALRAMGERCDVPALRSFVALVIQTELIGASIAQSLRIYSQEMRETRMIKAEEKALRIPVIMTVPLVTCILPVIVVALMLPAIIDVMRVLIPALTNGGH
jgi:tight adherence protein C